MGIPVDELQTRISSRRFVEYFAFYSLEPWGEERADLRSGIVASTIANANRDPKRHPKAFTPLDFMATPAPPELEEDDDEPDEDELAEHAAHIEEVMSRLGGPAE